MTLHPVACLRGTLLIAVAVALLDWSSKFAVVQLGVGHITNGRAVTPAIPLMVVAGAIALVLFVASRPMVVVAGLVVGGTVANGADRVLIGPVVDWIPEPVREGWYCNVADLALYGAFVLGGWVLYRLWVPVGERERPMDVATEKLLTGPACAPDPAFAERDA